MRKVILQEIVSLDGYAADPNGDVNLIPASARGDQRWGAEQTVLMDSIDTLLLGRVTYKMFSQFWPTRTEGEERNSPTSSTGYRKLSFRKRSSVRRGVIGAKAGLSKEIRPTKSPS